MTYQFQNICIEGLGGVCMKIMANLAQGILNEPLTTLLYDHSWASSPLHCIAKGAFGH